MTSRTDERIRGTEPRTPLEQSVKEKALTWARANVIDSSRATEMSETCKACGGYTEWRDGTCYGIQHKRDCWVPLLDYPDYDKYSAVAPSPQDEPRTLRELADAIVKEMVEVTSRWGNDDYVWISAAKHIVRKNLIGENYNDEAAEGTSQSQDSHGKINNAFRLILQYVPSDLRNHDGLCGPESGCDAGCMDAASLSEAISCIARHIENTSQPQDAREVLLERYRNALEILANDPMNENRHIARAALKGTPPKEGKR